MYTFIFQVIYDALEMWSNHANRDIKYLAIATTDAVLLQVKKVFLCSFSFQLDIFLFYLGILGNFRGVSYDSHVGRV